MRLFKILCKELEWFRIGWMVVEMQRQTQAYYDGGINMVGELLCDDGEEGR